MKYARYVNVRGRCNVVHRVFCKKHKLVCDCSSTCPWVVGYSLPSEYDAANTCCNQVILQHYRIKKTALRAAKVLQEAIKLKLV